MDVIVAVALLCGLMLAAGGALLWAQARLKAEGSGLIDAIDALLPQTQCAQCGYSGCRPYAEAVASGAAIDLCPPGGAAVFSALQALLGQSGGSPPAAPAPALAQIREEDCVGCFLCVRACPVDAIIGAPGFMHTVIEDECTGCELCLPACPVDCIDLVPNAPAGATHAFPLRQQTSHKLQPGARAVGNAATPQPCIGCNRCEPVCPAQLAPRELLWLSAADKWEAATDLGLDRCIECRLCDRACPSDIPLAQIFGHGKRTIAAASQNNARAAHAKARFEARAERLAAEARAAEARRAARLARISQETAQ